MPRASSRNAPAVEFRRLSAPLARIEAPLSRVRRVRRDPSAATELTPLDPARVPAELTGAAADEYRSLATELADRNTLAAIDANALAAYCIAATRWRAAEAKLAELGDVVKSPAGLPMPNPFASVAAGALRQMLKWGRELGLTPAARGELRRRA